MRRPRNDQKPKLLTLPPEQLQQLRHWLIVERVSYRVAMERLRERFGFIISSNALSHFWHSIARPGVAEPSAPVLNLHFSRCGKHHHLTRLRVRVVGIHLVLQGKTIKPGKVTDIYI